MVSENVQFPDVTLMLWKCRSGVSIWIYV